MKINNKYKRLSVSRMLRLNGFKIIDESTMKSLILKYKSFTPHKSYSEIYIKFDDNNKPYYAIDTTTLKVYKFNRFEKEWKDIHYVLPLYLSKTNIGYRGVCQHSIDKCDASVDDKRIAVLLFLMFCLNDSILPNFR